LQTFGALKKGQYRLPTPINFTCSDKIAKCPRNMFDQASLEYYAIRLDKFIVCRYFEFVIFWILSQKIKIPKTDNHFLVTLRNKMAFFRFC